MLPGIVGKRPFTCVWVEAMYQQPSLPPPSFQTRPIQSGVTLKNQATQQPVPTLTREGPHPALGSPHHYLGSGYPHVCARTGTLSGPSGLSVSLSYSCTHNSNQELNKPTLAGTWTLP